MKSPPKSIEWFDQRYYKVVLSNKETNDVSPAVTLYRGEKESIAYIPSVTECLGIIAKPFLADWRGRVGNDEANRIMYDALDKGSRVHHACWVYTRGGIVLCDSWKTRLYDDEARIELSKRYNGNIIILRQEEFLPFYRYVQFHNLVNPEMLASEITAYNLIHGVAGTVDAVMHIKAGEYQVAGSKPLKLDGGVYIVDLKTGKSIDDNYYMQVAAYAELLRNDFEDIRGALILHLEATTKTGIEGLNTHVRTPSEMNSDWLDFQHVAAVWNRKNRNRVPKVFDLPTYATMYPGLIERQEDDKES
jgi:hypothetical protein